MKLRKLNLIGDTLATATGATLFLLVLEHRNLINLGIVFVAILAALIMFKISRDCDITKDDVLATPDAYPIKFFIGQVLCTIGVAVILAIILFLICTYIPTLFALL
jgi:hypothetical protein